MVARVRDVTLCPQNKVMRKMWVDTQVRSGTHRGRGRPGQEISQPKKPAVHVEKGKPPVDCQPTALYIHCIPDVRILCFGVVFHCVQPSPKTGRPETPLPAAKRHPELLDTDPGRSASKPPIEGTPPAVADFYDESVTGLGEAVKARATYRACVG